eukprot:GILK01002272.1.p1 GENE.GILK01002272.1~~GILK01002272.1.p1  ORF type:complete len:355 (+),score=71.65 GILK01002272.1:51-1115(+)
MLQQPVNQVRLTNVAVVRLKKQGIRFEIACYKNKVSNWRSGVERDIDEVLQVHSVFTNVSKGILANKKELMTAFGTEDQQTVLKLILDKGEVQVSEKERQILYEQMYTDVATLVAQKCINPDTQRPFTVALIERTLRELHFTVKLNQTAKQQALDAIRLLASHIPIVRAQMRLRLSCKAKEGPFIKEKLMRFEPTIESEESAANFVMIFLADPGCFRGIDELLIQGTKRIGSVEILNPCVVAEGESRLDLTTRKQELTEEFASVVISDGTVPPAVAPSVPPAPRVAVSTAGSKRLTCNNCNCSFDSAEDHRAHFKSDLHRYNLKRKMKNLSPLSPEMFEDLSLEERDAFFMQDS